MRRYRVVEQDAEAWRIPAFTLRSLIDRLSRRLRTLSRASRSKAVRSGCRTDAMQSLRTRLILAFLIATILRSATI